MPVHAFAFSHPDKVRLEHLLSVRGDLGRADEALSSLLGHPEMFGSGGLLAEAVFTLAVVAYVRCFASGRRKGLSADIYAGDERLQRAHAEFKAIRDQHIAHAVGVLENLHVSVAAVDPQSPALGVGSLGVFFSHTTKRSTLLLLRRAVRFATKRVEQQVDSLGTTLASQLMDRHVTWKEAQKAFRKALGTGGYVETMYQMGRQLMKKAPSLLRK